MKQKVKIIISLALLLVMSMTMPIYAANTAETQASALKQLGLFSGVSATDFDLDRTPTKVEAVVMLIRLLGTESETLNGDWSHPFTDVASWADKCIGYAYKNGLIKGISTTEFGTDNANFDMYLTFMLRALGYDDTAGDFVLNKPVALAKSIGILPNDMDTANFLRADVALVSWAALNTNLKDGSQTLAEKLINANVFTLEDYHAAMQITGENEIQPLAEGEVIVSTFAELKLAVENTDISVIHLNSDLEITSELSFERDNDLAINIKKGVTLTVNDEFLQVGGTITNDGILIINSTFNRGICNFINNGSVTIKNSGTFNSGMSDTDNYGAFIVDTGGKLFIEKGSSFKNLGVLTNNGSTSITDGGCFYNENGSIINNGTIDLYSYFNGDIATITGTGKLNDNREE
ncbi:MAG: hypothetical protein PHI90_01055 [Clostridia bacterium]|nr:hypothetical protein [Clostridia bacterium]MDD4047412.1 hypothetical protein [Clostridia bacterium]